MVRVGPRVNEELKELIRGGLGPLLSGECERASDEGSCVRGAERFFVLVGFQVSHSDWTSNGSADYTFSPGGVVLAITVGANSADADNSRPMAERPKGLFLGIIARTGSDNDPL